MKNITIQISVELQAARAGFLGLRHPLLLLVLVVLNMCPTLTVGQGVGALETSADPVEQGWIPEVLSQNKAGSTIPLPDFSRAGYGMGERATPLSTGPVYIVTEPPFGAVPDDGRDDTLAIQSAIDSAERNGGGVVYLPSGHYEIRKDPSLPVLKIRSSNIIIRGAGAGEKGTILNLCSAAPAENVRRLATVPADSAARSGALISIRGNEEHVVITDIVQTVKRGEDVIHVADSSALFSGQIVVVSMKDPLIDTASPSPDKVAIAAQLTRPYNLLAQQHDTFGKAAQNYTWLVQVAEIKDSHTIRLAKTARFDHLLSYSPHILQFNGVQEVGIENIRLESMWPGGYQHHKPFIDNDGTVVRSAKEQDYLWNGIWVSHAVNVWAKNVTFHNLTQGIITSFVGDSTFDDLTFIGKPGHAGVTLGRSNDLLVSGAKFYAPLVHPVTLTMMSSGNVITDSETYYKGRDEYAGTDTVIDFHGLFPFENLFENLRGFYVCPGGDLSVLPHAGVRNVFWNIVAPQSMSCYTDEADSEFFRTYATATTSTNSRKTMYEHLPQAFFIGIRREGGRSLTVGNSSEDKQTKWHVIEGLGKKDIGVVSLYELQRKSREAATE
ncbi:glycosyl hydrolase family 28-related protein [Desulforhopalus sp. 52FAK]